MQRGLEKAEQDYIQKVEHQKASATTGFAQAGSTCGQLVTQYMAHVHKTLTTAPPPPPAASVLDDIPDLGSMDMLSFGETPAPVPAAGGGRGRGRGAPAPAVAGGFGNAAPAPAPVPVPAPAVGFGGPAAGRGRGRGAAPAAMAAAPPVQQPAQPYQVTVQRAAGGLGMVINSTVR